MIRNIQTREGYHVWDKLCAITRHAFLLSPEGNRVVKVPDMGNWIDMHEAQQVVDDAQSEINVLRDALERIRDHSECSSSSEIADWALKESRS